MRTLTLDTPLSAVTSINSRFIAKLAPLNIRTVRDLLWHFPTRYEDLSVISPIADLEPGQHATIQGVITHVGAKHSWRRHFVIIEARLEDERGDTVRAVWFNQPYLKSTLRVGARVNLAGKVSQSDHDVYLNNPGFELLGDSHSTTRHTGRLVPIYPETRGLTSKGFRFLIEPLLSQIRYPEDFIPASILEKAGLPELRQALCAVHFPKTLEEANEAQKRFSFEQIFLLHLFNFTQRQELSQEAAPSLPVSIEEIKSLIGVLPFTLTESQKKSLWEIVQDIGTSKPMNRLLQGDVGSGKTVVALLAALIAARNGFQTAIMAPTEVLARQHYETAKKLFSTMPQHKNKPPTVTLFTSAAQRVFYESGVEADIPKKSLTAMIARGEAAVVIGTHSLIQKTVTLHRLGLVIIDEQHRFGVTQRAALLKERNREDRKIPHFLSMSATPIPRTLMLTIFGDLDISTIRQMPVGRKKIVTRIVAPHDRPKAYAFIEKQICEGRQVFVICPRIAEADTSESAKHWDVASVHREFERLSQNVFPKFKVGMLHGQMKPAEKHRVMQEFHDRRLDILVSTSVIEVGVDVPNAVIMMIEGADRFGLSQLYQFRGRVGRGTHQSYCFLFSDSENKTSLTRLNAIVQAKNGFELAEKDLQLRGPGEFFGNKQTGLPDIAMRSLQNPEEIQMSRELAAALFKSDPHFARHPLLKTKIEEVRRAVHQE